MNSFINCLFQNGSWFKLTPTVHKVIIHGQEALEHFEIPISWLNEEVLETTNKTFKKNRANRASKISPEATLRDCFQRQIACSDPITLSKIYKNVSNKTAEPFSKDVMELILPFDPPTYSSWRAESDSESDVDLDIVLDFEI